jgi:hypothetical protein
MDARAFDGGVHLLEIADVGADAESGSAGVLDFEVTEVEFGFASRDESYAGAVGREANGKALANAASRAGNQHGHAVKGGHVITLVQNGQGVLATNEHE